MPLALARRNFSGEVGWGTNEWEVTQQKSGKGRSLDGGNVCVCVCGGAPSARENVGLTVGFHR